jgi:hypothetical protein
LKERSLYSVDYLKTGDISEKDPLYVVTNDEDLNIYKYYSEINIDGETFSTMTPAAKRFIK